MNDVIVDTSVWSLLLRRNSIEKSNPYVKMQYSYLEGQYCIHLPGIVLLEILDGIKIEKQFDVLNEYFEAFPLIVLERQDFLEAARLKNQCRSKGVQAGSIDFLIAAIAINRNYPLLSSDKDFQFIAKYCSLRLLKPEN